ncbi:GNAT family N-acetyltransferase [Bacillus cereus]|uniref:GNAT family N-acetyltransferase n=2 Tax=Bacillus cereus TaxID=1396 RepID=A0A2B0LQZ8_BACCE|nr:GNAT family N-acetyltransferase [Bacillus cereus]
MNPTITISMTKMIEQAEIDMLSDRLSTLQKIKGNPMQINMKRFENATAFSSKVISGPAFNTVKGITFTTKNELDEIISYYHTLQIPCRFEITPAHASPELFQYLHEKGFYQSDFHTALYGLPKPYPAPYSQKISIRELEEHEFHIFADIYVQGFRMPSFTKEGVRQNNQILFGKPGWHFYVAMIENVPASIGVLYMNQGIASLAASATLPAFQRRGCHTLLIQQRIHTAFTSQCQLLVGQALFGSASQNNMERCGMNAAYTKSIWTHKND